MDEQEARAKGTADNEWFVNAPYQSQCCPKLRELFGIDLRSLAVFRIAAAVLILIDLLLRFPFIEANYTDIGVLPRVLAPDHPIFFLHSLNGVYSFQCLCFVLTAVFTVMLLVGYRTTLATVAVWFLLACLHVPQPVPFGRSGPFATTTVVLEYVFAFGREIFHRCRAESATEKRWNNYFVGSECSYFVSICFSLCHDGNREDISRLADRCCIRSCSE